MNSLSNADVALGKEIRRHRRLANMTQKQVAAGLGVTGAQFHRYETGATRVTTSRLVAIAQILGVRPDSLLAVTTQPMFEPAGMSANPALDIAALLQMFVNIQEPKHRDALMALARLMSSAHPQPTRREAVVDVWGTKEVLGEVNGLKLAA